jgi:ABC-2 type transport system permease protein
MSTTTALAPRAPGARMNDSRRLWTLAWTLAFTDWKLRFYGSVLGYVWTLARPFAFFGVIYFVFTEIANLGSGVKNYAAYILFAMVLFNFFAEVTNNSVVCLITRENLLRKMRFPRLVIPLAVVITALLNLGMTLVAVMIFAIASGVTPGWGWLELPVLVVLLGAFAGGVGMLLSVAFVRYRDIQPIWEVFTQMLFYASPILYVATSVPDEYQRPYLANPIAAILTEMRHAVVDPSAASAAEAIGGWPRLLIPFGIIVVSVLVGTWAFRHEAPRIAENL